MDRFKRKPNRTALLTVLLGMLFVVSAQAQVGSGTTITVDSTYSGYDTSVINDGVIDAEGGTSTTWASEESTTEPHWVELEFSEAKNIDAATIHWAYNNKQSQYMTSQGVEVQAWNGSAYQTVATMTPAHPEASTTVRFGPVTTTKLRFYQQAGQGPVSYSTVMWLTEIDFGLAPSLTVDSTYPGYDTAAINDGVIDATGGTATTWASAESSTEPHWVQIELSEKAIIGSVTIHWAYNNKQGQYMTSQEIQVQLSDNTVATVRPEGPEASTTIYWEPLAYNSIRIFQPAGQGPASYDTVMWVTEIDVGLMQQPEASFTTEPSSGFKAGVAIGFIDTSTDADGTVTQWEWEFGDGNTSNDQHPIHTYAEPGSYRVLLAVADNDGRSNYTTRELHVGGTEVNSTYSGYSPSVIDDGVIDAMGGTSTTWASAESDEPHWVELHLGEESTVDFATIHWAYNDYQGQYMTSQQVVVQMWDGSSYQTVATMNPAFTETETTVTFDPVTTTRLRFYQPAGQGPATYDRVMWLTEIDYGLSD